ncbi:MAG: PASTA domain-containing protein [Gammaproteobacteria bacterium]|nr:PASTA domain-containing protein [Gammaproteobacteria bacterium]
MRCIESSQFTTKWMFLSLILLLSSSLSYAVKETITFIHTDHLGSPVLATKEDGSVKWREDYQPFGKKLTNEATDNNIGFTGHRDDKDLGLTYMQARWYHPEAGRFMGLDPILFRDVHSFNRYVYGNNNPYKYVDPDGKLAVPMGIGGCTLTGPACPIGGAVGAIIGKGLTILGIAVVLSSDSSDVDEPDYGAAGELPDLTDKTPEEAEEILKELGFEDKGKTEGGNSKFYHPDGSRVQIEPDGSVKVTGKKQDKQDGTGKYRPRLDKERNKLPHGEGLDNHSTGEILNLGDN